MRTLVAALVAALTPMSYAAGWRDVVGRSYVSDVVPAGDTVWVTFLGGGAAAYEPASGRVAFFTAAEGLAHNYVTAAAANAAGVFFATRNGVSWRAPGGGWRTFVRTWGYAHNDATDVAVTDRYVYVATVEGARCYDLAARDVRFEPVPASEGPAAKLSPQIEDGWRVFVNPDEVVLDDLYSVTVNGDDVYWGGRGRVFVSGPGGVEWREPAAELPPTALVRRVWGAGDAVTVITSEGVFAYDGRATARWEGPLGRVDCRDAVAFGGIQYFATAEGLYARRPDGAPFRFPAGRRLKWRKLGESRKGESPAWRLGVNDGLPDSRCTAVAPWEEDLVVGTEGGACLVDPATGEVRPLPIARDMPPGGVYALAAGAGAVWAATPEGLAALDPADLTVRKFALPGAWNRVVDVTCAGDEVLVTTPAGLLIAGPDAIARRRFELDAAGVAGEATRALKLGDRYVVGTTDGLVVLNAELQLERRYTAADGFPAAPVRALLPVDGAVACATMGGGLAFVKPESGVAKVLRAGAGLSSDSLFSLAADGGHLYVGTFDKGVDILTREGAWERNLSWGDGLSHTDIWAVAVAGDWLWLAIRGVGLNAVYVGPPAAGKEGAAPEVRRYYARYGLGEEYCKALAVVPGASGGTRLLCGTAAGVAVLDYEGAPPDYASGDYDGSYP